MTVFAFSMLRDESNGLLAVMELVFSISLIPDTSKPNFSAILRANSYLEIRMPATLRVPV